MNTCDACRWWSKKENDEVANDVIQRECLNTKVVGQEETNIVNQNVLYHGGWAELHTGPKFGCLHWETK